MAGKQELDAAIVALIASVNDSIAKANEVITEAATIITEGTAAISRLLQKIATGADTQPEIDQLTAAQTALTQTSTQLSATNDALTSAVATFKTEGV